jgi:hypothetical protein
MFDAANVSECYRRGETIVPQQALALSNSAMVLARAALIASNIESGIGVDPGARGEFIASAFERILGRAPSDAELALCAAGLIRLAQAFAAEGKNSARSEARARSALVHVLLNHNDFISIR